MSEFDSEFEKIVAGFQHEQAQLSAPEEFEVRRIVDMLRRGVNANAHTFSLAMRYSPDRWKAITDEVANRVTKGK